MNMSRPPLSEAQRNMIEAHLYPDWQPLIRIEDINLDIVMERMRLHESNNQWLRRQARGLRQEFVKKQ